MATILPENQINQELNSSVHQFFREQKLGTLLNQSNIRKEAGISPVLLVQFIFSLVLQKKNLYRTLESGQEPEKRPVLLALLRLISPRRRTDGIFRSSSGEAVFLGVEASRIILSSCQKVVHRRCSRIRIKSNSSIRSPVTKTPKSTPASRGAHIYALKVVSRCKPRCRRRQTARAR